MWVLLGLIVIIIAAEGRSLDSIGLHAPTWSTLGLGLAAAALIEATGALVFPALVRVGVVDFSKGFALLEKWPLWLLLFAILTAGVVEEALYRGYAIERLMWITGSYWWAAVVAVVLFGLVHLPFWGRGAFVWSVFAGSALTGLYVWKHDLLACVLVHTICNLKAMIFDPMVRRRRLLAADGPTPAD
jgi:membrane protease YdiL (CAAX protease family)